MQLTVQNKPLIPPQQRQGYYDIPFIYALNYFFLKGSNPRINGAGFAANQWRDVIPSQGDWEFHLRRHVPSWGHNFNLMDQSQNLLYSPFDLNPLDVSLADAMHPDLLVAPELVYPPGAGIRVFNNAGLQFEDLDTHWYAYYAMQGTKRIAKAPNIVPNYPYKERSRIYRVPPFTAAVYPAAYRFNVLVQNYDFELQAIYYYSGWGEATTTNFPKLALKLYDSGQYAMMSDYVDMRVLNTGNDPITKGPAGCFPTPPVIYPRGSQIIVEAQSLATTIVGNQAGLQIIELVGVDRTPC